MDTCANCGVYVYTLYTFIVCTFRCVHHTQIRTQILTHTHTTAKSKCWEWAKRKEEETFAIVDSVFGRVPQSENRKPCTCTSYMCIHMYIDVSTFYYFTPYKTHVCLDAIDSILLRLYKYCVCAFAIRRFENLCTRTMSIRATCRNPQQSHSVFWNFSLLFLLCRRRRRRGPLHLHFFLSKISFPNDSHSIYSLINLWLFLSNHKTKWTRKKCISVKGFPMRWQLCAIDFHLWFRRHFFSPFLAILNYLLNSLF